MKAVHNYKFFLAIFFFYQVAFSMAGEQLFHTQNIFPIYTWQIFHTEPNRNLGRTLLFVKTIDGQPLEAPTDILDLQKSFPNINIYEFSQKVHVAGMRDELSQEDLNNIKEMLLLDHSSVTFELKRITFDPIEYYTRRGITSEVSLGAFEATK